MSIYFFILNFFFNHEHSADRLFSQHITFLFLFNNSSQLGQIHCFCRKLLPTLCQFSTIIFPHVLISLPLCFSETTQYLPVVSFSNSNSLVLLHMLAFLKKKSLRVLYFFQLDFSVIIQ
jgi:hypothetical protein